MARVERSSGEGRDRSATLAPEVMARVRQIQVRTHRMVSNVLSGAYKSTFRGTGIEFEEVRAYQPGDDVRTIDWNVTARTGEPFVKTFIEERQLTLQFVVDTSRSMDFGTRRSTKRETAAELCALLAWVAVHQQDQVGLCLFGDRPGLHLPPRKGSGHVLRVVREVIAAEPEGGGAGLAEALHQQVTMLRRRSMVFVVGDFLDLGPEGGEPPWAGELGRLARRHDVIAVRVFDPFEEELPSAGIVPFREIESGRIVELDTRSAKVRERWSAAARERRARLDGILRRARVERIDLSTAEDVAGPIVRFFRARARRRT